MKLRLAIFVARWVFTLLLWLRDRVKNTDVREALYTASLLMLIVEVEMRKEQTRRRQ